MTPNAENTLTSLRSRSVVIVAPAVADARLLSFVLPATHFHVTVVHRFPEAKTLVATTKPDILVTELRLAEYNGLHLVLRAKADRPTLAAIVLSDLDDAVLRDEAERLGATFIVKPVGAEDLAAAIVRTFYRTAADAPVRPPFERRATDRRNGTRALAPLVERRGGERRRMPFETPEAEVI